LIIIDYLSITESHQTLKIAKSSPKKTKSRSTTYNLAPKFVHLFCAL